MFWTGFNASIFKNSKSKKNNSEQCLEQCWEILSVENAIEEFCFHGLINMMLFDKRTSVKRNTENVCFTSNETGLGLKFSIHCAIVRISTCFFSEKKFGIKF